MAIPGNSIPFNNFSTSAGRGQLWRAPAQKTTHKGEYRVRSRSLHDIDNPFYAAFCSPCVREIPLVNRAEIQATNRSSPIPSRLILYGLASIGASSNIFS